MGRAERPVKLRPIPRGRRSSRGSRCMEADPMGTRGKLLMEQPVEQVHGGQSHGDEEKTPGGTRTQGKEGEPIQEVRTSLKRLDARLCCGWSYALLGTQQGWTGAVHGGAVLFADVASPIQLSYTPPLAGMWNGARNTGWGA
ncbi:hypothetical protein ACQJBY_032690 [Aegilops geniculata]